MCTKQLLLDELTKIYQLDSFLKLNKQELNNLYQHINGIDHLLTKMFVNEDSINKNEDIISEENLLIDCEENSKKKLKPHSLHENNNLLNLKILINQHVASSETIILPPQDENINLSSQDQDVDMKTSTQDDKDDIDDLLESLLNPDYST